MSTHFVAWNFKPEVKEEDKPALKAAMKTNLDALVGKVPGLLTCTFIDSPLPGSNREIGLISTHATPEDVAAYLIDPIHNAAADEFVRPFTCDRTSFNW